MKVVREHYLRDDIYCGLPRCQECPNEASVEAGLTVGPLLAKDFPPRLGGDVRCGASQELEEE